MLLWCSDFARAGENCRPGLGRFDQSEGFTVEPGPLAEPLGELEHDHVVAAAREISTGAEQLFEGSALLGESTSVRAQPQILQQTGPGYCGACLLVVGPKC